MKNIIFFTSLFSIFFLSSYLQAIHPHDYKIYALDEIAKTYSNNELTLSSNDLEDYLKILENEFSTKYKNPDPDIVLMIKKGTKISLQYLVRGFLHIDMPSIPSISFEKDIYCRIENKKTFFSKDLQTWIRDKEFFKECYKGSLKTRDKHIQINLKSIIDYK